MLAFSTPLSRRIGLKYPLVCAPMFIISNKEMMLACAEAGLARGMVFLAIAAALSCSMLSDASAASDETPPDVLIQAQGVVDALKIRDPLALTEQTAPAFRHITADSFVRLLGKFDAGGVDFAEAEVLAVCPDATFQEMSNLVSDVPSPLLDDWWVYVKAGADHIVIGMNLQSRADRSAGHTGVNTWYRDSSKVRPGRCPRVRNGLPGRKAYSYSSDRPAPAYAMVDVQIPGQEIRIPVLTMLNYAADWRAAPHEIQLVQGRLIVDGELEALLLDGMSPEEAIRALEALSTRVMVASLPMSLLCDERVRDALPSYQLGLAVTRTADVDVACMGKLSAENLHLSLVGDWGDADLLHLSDLGDLRSLTLSGLSVSDAGLVHLQDLVSLTTLNLAGTDITGDGMASIRGLTQLRDLDVGGTAVDDDGVRSLTTLSKLTRLNLSNTQVTPAGLELLVNMPRLKPPPATRSAD